MSKKIISLLIVVSFLLISIVAFAQPPEPLKPPATLPGEQPKPLTVMFSLNLSPPSAVKNVGERHELVATVTRDGRQVSGVKVRFEFTKDSVNRPSNLKKGESFEIEVREGIQQEAKPGKPLPLISEHWKREKVYSATNNYVYCGTGPKGEAAKFAYTGIKGGEDKLLVSAEVDAKKLQAEATVSWRAPVSRGK